MNKLAAFLVSLSFVLTACAPATTPVISPVPLATQTPRPIPTLTATQPPTDLSTIEEPGTPTISPTRTITPIPTIPTITPTFDARTLVSATPAPKAECPKENPSLTANFEFPTVDNLDPLEKGKQILAFLNQGGTINAVINRLALRWKVHKDYEKRDVTGDGIDDFLFAGYLPEAFYIFKCAQGKYLMFSPNSRVPEGASLSWGNQIIAIEDMNKDNLPEVLIKNNGNCTSGCPYFFAYEWNGQDFINLSPRAMGYGFKSYTIKDSNNDGTIEIMLTDGILWCCYIDQYPIRYETHTFKWDGNSFTPGKVEYEQPVFRFQAVQDADQATLDVKYDEALGLYQQAIFSNKLEWWSPERKRYVKSSLSCDPNLPGILQTNPLSFFQKKSCSTAPNPNIDSTEYPKLAAYAYYRMVILHTHLGERDAAAIQYASLQDKFPAANPGHPYAEMASAFWEAYQVSQNMTEACGAAIAYAAEHPDMLIVLGSDYHGWQSHTYIPADVCPFR